MTHADEVTGDIRLECYVIDGRQRVTFRAYGRIDIIPEEDAITLSLTKQSRRSASGFAARASLSQNWLRTANR